MGLAVNPKSTYVSTKVLDKIHILRSQTPFSDSVDMSLGPGFFVFIRLVRGEGGEKKEWLEKATRK